MPQYLAHMLHVCLLISREDKDIIQLHKDELIKHILENLIKCLEHGLSISQSKRHY